MQILEKSSNIYYPSLSFDVCRNLFKVWNDSRLAWTKSSYGNVEYIYVPEDVVWHPELIVQNSVLELRKNLGAEKTVRIQYDGEVRWEPPAVLSTSCDMDVTYFPYDSQICEIELASWGFPADAVNLTFSKTHINLEDYRPDGEWDLITTSQYPSELIEDDLVFSELLFRIDAIFTVTLGMACLVIIFTIFVIRLFHQPEHDKAPNWMHTLARLFMKLKCRFGRINHLDQSEQSQSDRRRRLHRE
ncbi:CHRNA6 [Mytilus edulis]|uniref:CHRNA6 n=1 Tax=Mytilus edulis TaxID=6550 RepID=A0A8S3R8N6_MYTED|nr:CHRNA6 [Mytilus edulis]